ncbi:MAG: helix-turn-helix transcriptional regulator [Bacteroidota bacterium]
MLIKVIPDSTIKLVALGGRIKELRKQKGITQNALANNCDMEKSTISKIESGKVNIGYLVLLRLCDCLGVKLKDL